MAKSTKLSPNKTREVEIPKKTKNRRNLNELNQSKTIVLNFRVPAEFKRDFKIASATKGITQSELLKQVFEEWKKRHS
jgi:hypothetical protein